MAIPADGERTISDFAKSRALWRAQTVRAPNLKAGRLKDDNLVR